MFFDNFSSTKSNTLVLWLQHGSHLNLSFILIIIMIIVPSLSIYLSIYLFIYRFVQCTGRGENNIGHVVPYLVHPPNPNP